MAFTGQLCDRGRSLLFSSMSGPRMQDCGRAEIGVSVCSYASAPLILTHRIFSGTNTVEQAGQASVCGRDFGVPSSSSMHTVSQDLSQGHCRRNEHRHQDQILTTFAV